MSIVRQRVYGLALGYEDLNDHDELRRDLALQTAVEKDRALASALTLCRFEQRAGRAEAIWSHEVLIEQFMASHKRSPKRLVLDFDATHDRACMGCRRAVSITAVTTTTAFCPCMCSAGIGCW